MIKIKNCAIFGGTFDPIHNGHLHLIKALLKTDNYEKLIVVPAGNPWQKKAVAGADQRLEMLKLALSSLDIEISDCEIRREGPSYAIDSVLEIKAQFPAERYTWVIGSDAFSNTDSWHKIDELATMIEFLVVNRPGSIINTPKQNLKFEVIEIDALDISATKIRELIANGEDIHELVPDSVARFIDENGLYGAA